MQSFNRRSSARHAGLGHGRTPGQLLVFRSPRSREAHAQPRDREAAWRRAHELELRELAGQWVIVEGEELIAHGPDLPAIVASARARGIRVPYVFFVEQSDESVVKLGL